MTQQDDRRRPSTGGPGGFPPDPSPWPEVRVRVRGTGAAGMGARRRGLLVPMLLLLLIGGVLVTEGFLVSAHDLSGRVGWISLGVGIPAALACLVTARRWFRQRRAAARRGSVQVTGDSRSHPGHADPE